MRAYDVIKKKRDGNELTREEIRYFVQNYVNGEIPDYQASAFCMAVYFRGMTDNETAEFTFAIRDSGEVLDFPEIEGVRCDKHSTGGVGDKTSLVVIPVVASCGVKVAKMSGRGLGHTGGTVDKLEALDGYDVELTKEEFVETVKQTGMAIVGQSKNIAVADKMLYALRDVTATVDSIPLIASSIMGKKLAVNDDVIVLDVKTGSGAFMKTFDESVLLAKTMVDVGKRAGKKVVALVTDMDKPLGTTIGNALEVREAIEVLNGRKGGDFYDLCVELSTEILYLANIGNKDECKRKVINVLDDKTALQVFANTVKKQGGNEQLVFDINKIKLAKFSMDVIAEKNGYIEKTDTEKYGLASLTLGAGRNKLGEKIDLGAGIYLYKKTGDYVNKGEAICTLYTSKKDSLSLAKEIIKNATFIGENQPKSRPLVLAKID